MKIGSFHNSNSTLRVCFFNSVINYGFKNISVDYNTQSIINQVQVANTWGYTKTTYDQEQIGDTYGVWTTVTNIETK